MTWRGVATTSRHRPRAPRDRTPPARYGKWIDRHALFKCEALETSEVDVRVYGAAAVVRNVQRDREAYEGHPVALTVRVSQVRIAQADGGRRIVAIQFSPMASDEAR